MPDMGVVMKSRVVAAVVVAGSVATVTPAAPAAAGPAGSPATRIVLERAGGFTGDTVSFAVDRSTVGGREPLRLAGSPAFRRLRGSYLPAHTCCDRFTYRVTVTWRGGHRKTVSTVQGATAPRVLWDVIRQTEKVGVRPLV